MSYTKLDSSITDSTIWQAPDTTRIVWITMLAMADQNGYIGGSVPGLAGRARVSLDACVAALECLTEPDIWSRTKEHEGRRIAEADGGWVLLNHAKYRATQNADDRRERSRVAMADLRASRKQLTPAHKQLASVNQKVNELTKLTQAEAEEEEEKKDRPVGLSKENEIVTNGHDPLGDAPKRATKRCPPDFSVTAKLLAQIAIDCPGVDFAFETKAFQDFEFKTAHSDWPAAWRNWMRGAFKRLPPSAKSAPYRGKTL